MEKIGILGSGQVAQALGNGFIGLGHEVMLGSRDGSKSKEWLSKAGERGHKGDFAETAAFGDIIVLAVKGTVAEDLVRKVSGALNGKLVIDATNPIAEAPPENGVLKLFTSFDQSLMEKLQHAAAGANFVKAFNSVGNTLMVNPSLPGGKPSMFICGNDASARKRVGEILEKFGWEVEDMGGAEAARAIEPLCILWCIPGFIRNQWNHAFKLLKM
jgi:8-hydroxy-5-deazaflavin:NADPH oxidoreductase